MLDIAHFVGYNEPVITQGILARMYAVCIPSMWQK